MHGRYARYAYSGDPQSLARRAEAGMLPIFQSSPGFKAYTVVDIGGEIISFSAWESAEAAEAANALAADWVRENMSELELRDARVGEVLFSSILGVTTGAGATA